MFPVVLYRRRESCRIGKDTKRESGVPVLGSEVLGDGYDGVGGLVRLGSDCQVVRGWSAITNGLVSMPKRAFF